MQKFAYLGRVFQFESPNDLGKVRRWELDRVQLAFFTLKGAHLLLTLCDQNFKVQNEVTMYPKDREPSNISRTWETKLFF